MGKTFLHLFPSVGFAWRNEDFLARGIPREKNAWNTTDCVGQCHDRERIVMANKMKSFEFLEGIVCSKNC